jgi:hypothetical protein
MSILFGQYANLDIPNLNLVQIGAAGFLKNEENPYFLNSTVKRWLFTGAPSTFITQLVPMFESIGDQVPDLKPPVNVVPIDEEGNYGFALYPVKQIRTIDHTMNP